MFVHICQILNVGTEIVRDRLLQEERKKDVLTKRANIKKTFLK